MNANILQPGIEVPTLVYWIWGITLALAILVILPLTVYLLQRTLSAARNIERYLMEMRDAGIGIANNTEQIKALDDTIDVATHILGTAASIKSHTTTIKTTLASRVESDGQERTIA